MISLVFFAIQETDHFVVTGMQVLGYTVHGCDHDTAAILCLGPLCQIRRSCSNLDWVHDDSISLHAARWERRGELHHRAGDCEGHQRISSLAATSTSSSNSTVGTMIFRVFDSLDWYGLYGPECRGRGDDVVTCDKTPMTTIIERFRLRGDEYLGEPVGNFTHFVLGFGETGKNKIDFVMGPRDLESTTWSSNTARPRNWDHCLFVVDIEEEELRVRKGTKGWGTWMSMTEEERLKFQRQTLYPGGSVSWVKGDQEGVLESLEGWRRRRRSRQLHRRSGTRTSSRSWRRWRQRWQKAGVLS